MNKRNNINIDGVNDRSVRLAVSPSPVAAETFLYTQRVGYLEVGYPDGTPSFTEESDYYDSFLMMFITRGRGTLVYEGKETTLERGDFTIIDCKKPHKYCTTGANYWNFLYLYFNGNQAAPYYKILSKAKTSIYKVDDNETLMSLFWQVISLYKNNDSNAEPLASMYITRILTEMCLLSSEDKSLSFEYPSHIKLVFHIIDHFYDDKITLDMLAEHCGVNKFHLAREFKRYTGTTINEYLVGTRINKAKSLLRFTERTVEQVADEVGFYGSSHFIKSFKEREHITPFNYRQQWKS